MREAQKKAWLVVGSLALLTAAAWNALGPQTSLSWKSPFSGDYPARAMRLVAEDDFVGALDLIDRESLIDAPALQVLRSRCALAQLLTKEVVGRRQRLISGRIAGAVTALRPLKPVAISHGLERGDEIITGNAHVKPERITSSAEAETVEEPLVGIDRERRGLLLVKRAQSKQPLASTL